MEQGSTALMRFRSVLCFSVHPVVREQIAAPQPSWLLLGVVWIAGSQLGHFLSLLLSKWSYFVAFSKANPSAFVIGFVLIQLGFMAGGLFWFATSHRACLWRPKACLNWRCPGWQILCLLLAGYHVVGICQFSVAVARLIELAPHDSFRAIQQSLFTSHGWGSSLMGVVMFGVFTIAAPFWEEPLFSGMVANRLVAKFGPMFGAILTSGLFALSHVPVYGWSSKLVSLMFAGLTYTALRLLTGNIGVAIAAHLIVNVLTVLPKWVLAWYHFRHGALTQS